MPHEQHDLRWQREEAECPITPERFGRFLHWAACGLIGFIALLFIIVMARWAFAVEPMDRCALLEARCEQGQLECHVDGDGILRAGGESCPLMPPAMGARHG